LEIGAIGGGLSVSGVEARPPEGLGVARRLEQVLVHEAVEQQRASSLEDQGAPLALERSTMACVVVGLTGERA